MILSEIYFNFKIKSMRKLLNKIRINLIISNLVFIVELVIIQIVGVQALTLDRFCNN